MQCTLDGCFPERLEPRLSQVGEEGDHSHHGRRRVLTATTALAAPRPLAPSTADMRLDYTQFRGGPDL
jgi:hypothetical protein